MDAASDDNQPDRAGENLESDERNFDDREHSLVSLNALTGYNTPNTLSVTKAVQGHSVRILIDGGSTHNFV